MNIPAFRNKIIILLTLGSCIIPITFEIKWVKLGEGFGLFPKQAEDYLLFAAVSVLSGYLKTVLDEKTPRQKAKQYALRALVGMLCHP